MPRTAVEIRSARGQFGLVPGRGARYGLASRGDDANADLRGNLLAVLWQPPAAQAVEVRRDRDFRAVQVVLAIWLSVAATRW